MPRGPQGQKRPPGVVETAVKVAKIATGEIIEEVNLSPKGRKGGLKGGTARAETLSAERRREIAKKAARARWREYGD